MNGLFHHETLLCSSLTHTHRDNIRVLIPGAGLGRLAYDIAKLGKFQSYNDIPSDASTTRIHLSGKRILPLHALRVFLHPQ